MKRLSLIIIKLLLSLTIAATQLAFADIHLNAKEKQWIADHPTIKIGIDSYYAPIEMETNGKHDGMTADYFALIAEKTGLNFQLESYASWQQTKQAAEDGKIDLLTAIRKTPGREQQYTFSQPYIFIDTAIITSTSMGNELSIDDLSGKKIAIVAGYFWQEILEKEYPDFELHSFNNLADGLVAVAFGQVDAMFASLPTATHYINEQEITHLQVSGLTPYKLNYAIAVHRHWPILTNILNKALSDISPEEHEAIKKKWIKLDYHIPWYNKKAVLITLISLICCVLLIIMWNYSLRRKVKQQTVMLAKANNNLGKLVEKRTAELHASNIQLQEIAKIDSLTKAYNRHYFDEQLAQLFNEHNAAYDQPFSLLIVDVDCFKQYNDYYGHLEGDQCLLKVATILKSLANRSGEFFARYGGEEFIYVLPGSNAEIAQSIADKALACVQALCIEHEKSIVNNYVSISIGSISVPNLHSHSSDELFEQADIALYQAKKQGRNRLVSAHPSSS